MKKFIFLKLLFVLLVIFSSPFSYSDQNIITEVNNLPTATNVTADKQITSDNNSTQNSNEQSGYSQGSVTRSIFTTEIVDHEPTNDVKKLHSDNRNVYYFTELRDMSGQTAIHRWEFNGNVMAEKKFTIDGPRWRVWSSKNLLPSWVGEWKVSVINGAGNVISEDIVNYVEKSLPQVMPEKSTESITSQANSSDQSIESTP